METERGPRNNLGSQSLAFMAHFLRGHRLDVPSYEVRPGKRQGLGANVVSGAALGVHSDGARPGGWGSYRPDGLGSWGRQVPPASDLPAHLGTLVRGDTIKGDSVGVWYLRSVSVLALC